MRTEEAYTTWIKRFISFHDLKDPRELDSGDIRKYLDFLAGERNVSSATQNLAVNSLVFLYKQVLKKDPGEFRCVNNHDLHARARPPRRESRQSCRYYFQ